MIVMPYYNKPSQDGHARARAGRRAAPSPAPIVLYNIPGRTVVDLSADTTERICDAAPNVVAIKDAERQRPPLPGARSGASATGSPS